MGRLPRKDKDIKTYCLTINRKVFNKLKKYSKEEYKTINSKLTELIDNYVESKEKKRSKE